MASPTATAAIIFLSITAGLGTKIHHNGKAVWCPDGSWHIDWPAINDLAAAGPHKNSDPNQPDMQYILARALIIEKAAGKLLEKTGDSEGCYLGP